MMPRLRFHEREITKIASRYDYSISEKELEQLRPKVIKRGYLLRSELQHIAYWKAPRSSGYARTNPGAKSERSRIEILTILYSISWPSASVILNFCHANPYPIIDYRSLWSVGLEVPNVYHFELWWCYTAFCREIAQRNHIDMRTLDRALWQYSKENQ